LRKAAFQCFARIAVTSAGVIFRSL